MGQRLVIEIYDSKVRLANAYYHWSGYTSSSLGLLRRVISALDSNLDIDDLKLRAIKALEETGAGLWKPEDRSQAKALFPDISFKDCIGRNEGMIAIRQDTMKELFDANEAFIKVDISNNCFVFDVFWTEFHQPTEEDFLYSDAKKVEIIETTFNLDCLYFGEFDALVELCEEISCSSWDETIKIGKVYNDNGEELFIRNIE